jgi:predicted ATPase
MEEEEGFKLNRPLKTPKTTRAKDIRNSGEVFLRPPFPQITATRSVRKHNNPENKLARSPGTRTI